MQMQWGCKVGKIAGMRLDKGVSTRIMRGSEWGVLRVEN